MEKLVYVTNLSAVTVSPTRGHAESGHLRNSTHYGKTVGLTTIEKK
jgi:hypothetical protein